MQQGWAAVVEKLNQLTDHQVFDAACFHQLANVNFWRVHDFPINNAVFVNEPSNNLHGSQGGNQIKSFRLGKKLDNLREYH